MSRKEDRLEASKAVDEAIDLLNRVPRNYGGHVEKEGTSAIDGVLRDDGLWLRAEMICRYPVA